MSHPVHIGIVTYNNQHDIQDCLNAVFRQSYSNHQVSIVDNASSDETALWIKINYPEISFTENSENVGFGCAHNQIMKTIDNAHYLALNPDAILAPDYIEKLVEELDKYDAGWVIGKLLLPDGQHIYSAGHALLSNGFAFNIGYGMPDAPQFNEARQVFGASGAAVLYSSNLIGDLGQPFFDETLFLYAEDVDVDWRSQHHGWDCWYIAAATATHRGSNANAEMQSLAVANRYLSILKNSCLFSLIIRHIPIMLVHILLRLIITPRNGWKILRTIWRYAPVQWRKRQSQKYDCNRLQQWHVWSKQQVSYQPHTLSRRIQHFISR